jgi:hypothetical protein
MLVSLNEARLEPNKSSDLITHQRQFHRRNRSEGVLPQQIAPEDKATIRTPEEIGAKARSRTLLDRTLQVGFILITLDWAIGEPIFLSAQLYEAAQDFTVGCAVLFGLMCVTMLVSQKREASFRLTTKLGEIVLKGKPRGKYKNRGAKTGRKYPRHRSED